MLGLMNLPELLGLRSEMQVMKRTGDQVDAWLATLLAALGVVLYWASLSSPRLACVPVECPANPLMPKCALDWSYQSHLCEEELLSYPDVSFHLLLLLKGALFLSVLILPIFYGNAACTDQFTRVSSLWKLRSNALVTSQTEWRRNMHLALQQLKSSSLLTRHYSLYHILGLALDFISLLISCLYSLHFLDFHLTGSQYRQESLQLTAFFSPMNQLCQNGTFHCEMGNLSIYKWFGLLGSLLLTFKVVNRLLCLGFSLAIPGLFWRPVLLHCSRLQNVRQEPVYRLEARPLVVLRAVLGNVATAVLRSPLRSLAGFLDFYFYNSECKTAINFSAEDDEDSLGDVDYGGSEAAFLTAAMAAGRRGALPQPAPQQGGTGSSEGLQNWADFFFVLDTMSGSIDVCELLVFISKTDQLINELEEKRVDGDLSQLDAYSNRLELAFTTTGCVEHLLEQELGGKLEVRGWLEGDRGRIEADPKALGKSLVFSVDMGSSYELVSAVFARGRQLVRLPPYKVTLPSEVRPKLRKRYGSQVPLSALCPLEVRPSSRNSDR